MKMLYPRKIDEVLWHSRHAPVFKIDFGENSQAADDPGNRIPIHVHQLARTCSAFLYSAQSIVLIVRLLFFLVGPRV